MPPRRAAPPRAHGTTVSLAAAGLALLVAVSSASPSSVRSAQAQHTLHLNTVVHSAASGGRALLAAGDAGDDGPFGIDNGGGDVEPDDLDESAYDVDLNGKWPRRRAARASSAYPPLPIYRACATRLFAAVFCACALSHLPASCSLRVALHMFIARGSFRVRYVAPTPAFTPPRRP